MEMSGPSVTRIDASFEMGNAGPDGNSHLRDSSKQWDLVKLSRSQKLGKRKREESEDAAMRADPMEVSGPSEFEDSWKLVRAKAELDLQMDVYVSGSSNAGRIQGRVSLLTNMFLDFRSLRIDPANLTEWEAALWTRSRVNSGAKSAGSSAKTALSAFSTCGQT